ncbi:hypothetical protein [Pedobacter sp. B4-66]|uniref:hypothetical protein n=1 Tax=Pedobacter sp. B4-66 TaxID=2817280 RepID=UPI001BD9F852|nr:hypothetical protein [Pedobacter sp. B4-66]
MKIRNIILIILLTPLSIFAQTLGANQGDHLEISSVGGATTNIVMNKLWLYRPFAGNNWYNSRLHDGISVDASFLIPHVNTKTWWERDPLYDIQSWGNAASTYLTINQGNVGIGTATPNAKLAVNGNIRAKEIKVETANWPDYVFAKDYQLPSLQETEQHIKEKGHLPGIPSAEEVKANGVDLGEMNAKLLKKIEELTLHQIEQEKKNNAQAQAIQKLEKRLLNLETKR